MALFKREKPTPAQFSPDFSRSIEDVERVRSLARGDNIGQQSAAGLAQQRLLDVDRNKALGDLKAAQSGRLATQSNQLALSGGASQGARERLGAQNERQGGLFTQGLIGDFARESANIRNLDFAQQEALRNKAIFAAPGVSGALDSQQAAIEAANAQARAAAEASKGKSSVFGKILQIGGAAVGTYFGGPAGGAAAYQAGGALNESLGI